jgi:hypothetical protein
MTHEALDQILALAAAASPPPVALMRIPDDYPPIDWIADCLNRSTRREVWGVVLDTLTATEEGVPTAITGNGPTSQANAEFYVMCHTAVPLLVAECRRLHGIALAAETQLLRLYELLQHRPAFEEEPRA